MAFALGWFILLAAALSFGLGKLVGVRRVRDWGREREPEPLFLKTRGLCPGCAAPSMWAC